jgi:mono/diheme cytochrome c family protein
MKSVLLVLGGAVLVVVMTAGASTAAEPASAVPTFNKDVAAILFNNCVTCHRPNQIAPMTLMSYQDVRPWARAIKDKVTKGEMPPWFADGRFGEFRNDRRLTPEQIQIIAAWVDGGAPEGDTPLAARLPDFKDGWIHPSGRPPDFIIEMADAFEVPASGELPNFTIYQELPQELRGNEHFVEAIQMLPGVIPAVHHASFGVAAVPPGRKVGTGEAWPGGPIVRGALLDAKTGKSVGFVGDANEAAAGEGEGGAEARRRAEAFSGARFCCYVPGGSFQQFRPGAGKRIPTEGYIAWGMHYTPIGKPVADRTRVGLWFQNDMNYEVVENGSGGTHIVLGKQLVDDEFTPLRTSGVGNTGFPALPVIPPHAKNWAITSIRVFQDDVTLYTAWPHMHTRGKEMTYVLTYPDGREQVLLSVPKYDFNWQIFYELKEPIKIPAGSTLKTIGSYDNSPANKWNAAPHKEVYWSEQSWDEMYIGFIDISVDKRDLKKRVRPQTDGQ